MSAVPAWKQAILNKKREKEEEEERARLEEEKKLSKLPQWKRDLLLRKHASEDRGSPPLNRAAISKNRPGSGSGGSFSKKRTPPVEKHTLAVGRDRSGSSDSVDGSSATDQASTATIAQAQASSTKPAAAPTSTTTTTSPESSQARAAPVVANRSAAPSDEAATSVDDVDGGEAARPSVKHLLGLFGTGRARSDSDDRPADAGLETRSGSVGSRRPTAQVSPVNSAMSNELAAKEAQNGPSRPSVSSTEFDEEDEDEGTLIDDVISDEVPKGSFTKLVTPPRKQGIMSAPVSPTMERRMKGRTERRPSCLASTDKPRKVSFFSLRHTIIAPYAA